MKKRIFMIITKGVIGGPARSVSGLAKGLVSRGHSVTVGIGKEGDVLPSILEKEGIAWVRINTLVRGHNPIALLRFVGELRKMLRAGSYDVLQINSSNALPGAFAARLVPKEKRPKTVFTFRGMSLLDTHYELSAPARLIYTLFFKIFLFFVDVPVFISEENMARGKELGMAKRSRLIYNGLTHADEDFLPRAKAREELGVLCGVSFSDDAFLMVSVGRIAYQKDYPFLVRAFAQFKEKHPKAHLIIIGEGDERELVEEEIAYHHLEAYVHLTGAIPEAFRYLRAADLCTLTSRYEGLSIALIEALMAGVRIVASDVGGNGETILSEGIYAQSDEEAFLAACERVLALPEDELQARTKEKADMFTTLRMVDGYEEVFERVS